MSKLTKELKVVFSPKDINDLIGKNYELSFNETTQETEIWENNEIVGIYNNGIPKEIEDELVNLSKDQEEYKLVEYYAEVLGKSVRRLIKPAKNKNSRNGLSIEFWVEL